MTFEFIGLLNKIMILSALFGIPIVPFQVGQVTETKLFRNEKGKVVPGSIAVSPNLQHYSYSTVDHKIMIDGKAFGPYLSNGIVAYSGNSDDYAFLASQRQNAPSTFFLNGVEKNGEFPIFNVFRAGESGGLAWVEHKYVTEKDEKDPSKTNKFDFTRLVYNGGNTEWFERIEKMSFSDDGSLYAIRVSEKVKASDVKKDDPDTPTSKDYIVRMDGEKTPRAGIMQIFPAPNAQGYATLTGDNTVIFRNKVSPIKGEFYGKPMFSPDGKQFVYRNSFTGARPDGRNVPFYQYTINGYPIPDLQIQTGLVFAPDGKKWVMCGMNGKDHFLYISSQGMVAYSDFPGLAGAPLEPYKEARFAAGKIVLLFQPKKSNPILFIEDKGITDLGEMTSAPETISISPDGKKMVLGCQEKQELHAFAVDLENPVSAVPVIAKKGYDLQNLGKGTFVWRNDHEVTFLILRNSDMTRVSASL